MRLLAAKKYIDSLLKEVHVCCYWRNKQQSDHCKIPSDGVLISSGTHQLNEFTLSEYFLIYSKICTSWISHWVNLHQARTYCIRKKLSPPLIFQKKESSDPPNGYEVWTSLRLFPLHNFLKSQKLLEKVINYKLFAECIFLLLRKSFCTFSTSSAFNNFIWGIKIEAVWKWLLWAFWKKTRSPSIVTFCVRVTVVIR